MATATPQEFEVLTHFVNHMLDAFPNAQWDTDNDGQIVIYTNLRRMPDGSIGSFEDIP